MQARPVPFPSPQPVASFRQSGNPMSNLPRTVVVAVAFGLAALGFLLQLGGVGDAHKDCADFAPSSVCAKLFRAHWWATFFNLIVSVATLLVVLLQVLDELRIVVIGFLSISALQMMDSAERFLPWAYEEDEDDQEAAAAGYVISTMGCFLLIIALGMDGMPSPKLPTFPKARPAATGEVPVGGGVSGAAPDAHGGMVVSNAVPGAKQDVQGQQPPPPQQTYAAQPPAALPHV